MNVCVLIGSISSQTGGPAYTVRRLWQSVAKHGMSISVHTTDMVYSGKNEVSWQPLSCRVWPVSGFRPLGYSKPMKAGLLGDLYTEQPLISQHGIWLHQGRLARMMRKRLGVPVIIHPHGMLEPWALRRSKWKKQIVGALWEYENLMRANCIRATAQSELQSIRLFGLRNPVAVIPNGVDVEQFRALPSPADARAMLPSLDGRRVLLFLSRVHPKKGLPMLLNVWKRLRRLRRDWILAIAGPDQVGHTEELKKMVVDLDIQNSVAFLGPLFGEAKLAAFSLADLFILPTYSENFGVAVAEALAAQVPVVTTKGAPWQGLIEHNCGWWTEVSEEAIESALGEALPMANPELRRMGTRGGDWVANDFAWTSIARQMIEVCQWLRGGGSPPSSVSLL